MRAILTGANGQLGRSLAASVPDGMELIALSSAMLDITDGAAVEEAVRQYAPKFLINAAAYTKVDAAEECAALADEINRAGVENLALAARNHAVRLIHISTDFVFDGRATSPYRPDALTSPLNIYGKTKLAGELAAGTDALIIRTGWLYSSYGNNFVATMLRLMREKTILRVVDDQIGTPTNALSLARAIWDLAVTQLKGVYHFSDSGTASWHNFAVAIMEEAMTLGLLDREIAILPITADQYPTQAARPKFSVLDKSDTFEALGWVAPHWRAELREVLKAIKTDG